MVFEGGDAHAVEDFAGKGACQHPDGLAVANATGAQIEQSIFVELADGGSVRTLDVVGVDFELGLGVDLGRLREQEVLVGLVGVGFLRGLVNVDLAAKDAGGPAAEDALVEFVALAVRLGVFDERVVIDVLCPVFDVEAVERGVNAFSL